MALYAFDGTGNEDKDGDDHDSNILFFFRAYPDALKNDDAALPLGSLYLKGIGTRAKDFVGVNVAEAFGIGGHQRVDDALGRLERNFAAGDEVIDVIGFSRGAALAISFANQLAKTHPERQIRFIGVFDVVGEFGLPGQHFNAGHDLHFPPNVQHCFHAMALDEHRQVFQLTRLSKGDGSEGLRLQEVWFRGVHSDIGGSNNNRSLNWITLNWMYENAIRAQLPIDATAVGLNLARKDGEPKVDHKFEVGLPRRVRDTDLIHFSVKDDHSNPLFPHVNPRSTLARINDAGLIVPGQAANA